MATPKPTPKPTPKITIKPKATPMPKFTTPTLSEYKNSAAGRNGEMTYKQYIGLTEQVYKAKQKQKKK
jgi:hypothetical protein